MNFNKNNIPEDGKFVEDCKSSKSYAGGFFHISNEKYLIVGGTNKIEEKYRIFPLREPLYRIELYDNNKKKIVKANDYLFYLPPHVSILDNDNLLISTGKDLAHITFYILNKKTLKLKNIISALDLYDYNHSFEALRAAPLPDNRILFTNSKTVNAETYIYDLTNNTIKKGPHYHKDRVGAFSILVLNKDEYMITGGYLKNEKDRNSIEICSISKNKCVMQKSKLSSERPNRPLLFKTQDNKILIVDLFIWDDFDAVELFDPKTDSIEVLGIIPKNGIEGRTYTRLQNGNILITGGEKGIMIAKRVKDAYIFDIEKRELRKIEGGMKYARSGHLTGVLENGDVLICGGNRGLTRCERYISRQQPRRTKSPVI